MAEAMIEALNLNNETTKMKKKQANNDVQSDLGSGAGQSAALPAEVEPGATEEEPGAPADGTEEIPIGMPVSAEEFKKLKAQAEEASGQGDSATQDEADASEE